VRVSLAVNVIFSPKLHLARRLKNAQTKLSSRQYFSKLKFLYFRRRAYVGLQHTVGKILRMRLRQPPLYAADRRAKTRQENHKHICFEGKLRIFPLVDVIISAHHGVPCSIACRYPNRFRYRFRFPLLDLHISHSADKLVRQKSCLQHVSSINMYDLHSSTSSALS
jgi:hypothetical protein